MEKAKAYIKNELRGGSQLSEPATTPNPTSPSSSGTLQASKQPYAPVELMPSPGAAAHRSSRTPGEQYHLGYQQNAAQHYYAGVKSTGRASAPPDHHHVPMTICFVCGGHGGYEPQPLRIRHNAERPAESYFPFLERHDPPNGLPGVTPGQDYVWACMLCFRSLNEQWDAYERQKKPLLQRIYHMKRVDGKGYIGADVATQSEYAAQVLGLSAEHLTQNGLVEGHGDPYALARHYSPQLQQSHHHHSTSRNASPSPNPSAAGGGGGGGGDFYPRNSTPSSNHNRYLSRPQSRDMPVASPSSRPPSEPPAMKSAGYAQQKFKLSPAPPPAGYQGQAPYHPAQYQQLQQQTAAYHLLQQQVNAGGGAAESAHYKGNPYSALPSPGSAPLGPPVPSTFEDDNATCAGLTELLEFHQPQSEVGILDLSMPDKNSITEVCYVCGDEQRRGSLIELSTVKPRETGRPGQAVAYFPLFNEQHPRPARSRPKDPRGMIQACLPCYEDLIQQWNAHQ
ncbi:hypothetical protein M5D96_009595, partial [Drosophila gunungcola]